MPSSQLPHLALAVFNLVEGIDVAEMELKLKNYRLENADNILLNEARKARR